MCRKVARGLQSFIIVEQWVEEGGNIRHTVFAQDMQGILHFICKQGSYGNTWMGYHNAELHHDYPDIDSALRAQGYVQY